MQKKIFDLIIKKQNISLLLVLLYLLPTDILGKEIDLYIYSSRQESIIAPIIKKFSEKYNYKIEVLYISKGILERLRQERILSKSDLILTSDLSVLITASKEGLLLPLVDKHINSVVPTNLRSSKGEWYGLSKRIRLVFSSINRVNKNDIETIQDLANPKWKGRICVRSGYHNYNLSLFSAFLTHYGKEKLKSFLLKLKANLATTPKGNDRFQVKSIWQGKCDISIGNSYYYGLMLNNKKQKPWAQSVRPVFATIGKFGSHINVSGIGILKSVKNKVVAIELIKFLLSKDVQKLYTESTYEYPIRTDIKASKLVQSWGSFKSDSLSLQEIARNRALTLKVLKEVDFDN